MSFVPFVVLLATPEAIAIADKLATNHNKMTKAAVYVSDGLTPAAPTRVRMSPGTCIVAMPNQQIVEMHATNVRFFDEIFNQVAPVKPQKPLKIPDSAPSVSIVHREPLSWLVDAKQRSTFFNEIKRDPRWAVKGSSLTLSDAKKKVRSEVFFDTAFRVVEIRLIMNGKTLTDWKYRYVSDSDVPGIPATAKAVKGLASRPNLPAKTDGRAVLIAQKMWRSVSRLDGRTVVQTNEDGTYQTSLIKGLITESGPKGTWKLTSGSLSVDPKSGSNKTLSAPGKYLDGLRTSGISASPFAWYILNRKIPFLDVFDQCEKLELEGQGNFGGKQQSILSLKRKNNRIRMYVDASSGDLNMVSSDALDASGNVISSSRVKITYR